MGNVSRDIQSDNGISEAGKVFHKSCFIELARDPVEGVDQAVVVVVPDGEAARGK